MSSDVGPLRVRPARRLVVVFCAVALAVAACGGRSTLEPGEWEPPSAAPTSDGGRPMVAPPPPTVKPMKPMPTAPPCEQVTLTIDELRPAVTLLVDQSLSMNQSYPTRGSGQSRWSIVRQALMDPNKGVVATLQRSVQFGLSFYTSYNGSSGGVCPVLSEVVSATDNYAAIAALYDRTSPADDTPTGAAIEQVVNQIRASTRTGPEVILLVTDGDPDTCAQPDPQGGQLEAVNAASNAFRANIGFYVLGVSSDISGNNLQQLANAGQGKPLDARWGVDANAAEPYQASSSVAGLTQQLQEILANVPLCEVELERDVAPEELRSGDVTLDGQPLQFGNPDGFRQKDPRHLQIVGKACDSLRTSGKKLSVRISCQ